MKIINYDEKKIEQYIDDIIKIDREAFASVPSYDRWELKNFIYKLPDKEKLSFLLFDDEKDKMAGFIISSSYADATHLNRIAVGSSYQGQSWGKKLVEKFLDESRNLGFKRTTLSTVYDLSHDYVIDFYKKMDYRLLESKEDIQTFLEVKGKPQDFDLFYPPNQEGKLLVMEKYL